MVIDTPNKSNSLMGSHSLPKTSIHLSIQSTSRHTNTICLLLAKGPLNARQPIENTKISQPTASRTLATLGDEAVRIGAGFAIQYALRDASQVYAAAHAAGLCLPANPEYWNDDEFLQALQVLGHKIVSDRLIGETAKRIARVG